MLIEEEEKTGKLKGWRRGEIVFMIARASVFLPAFPILIPQCLSFSPSGSGF